MKLIDLEQNTPEWLAFRLGKIGGSRLGSIWSTKAYKEEDVINLLTSRNFDFAAHLAAIKKENPRKQKLVKADLDALLTEADKMELKFGGEKKLEFYQILADSVAIAPEDDEIQYRSAMDRGHELEDEACEAAAEKLGKKVMAVGCMTIDEDERIYNSPDRIIVPKGVKDVKDLIEKVDSGKVVIKEEMEAKCLASSKHLMAYFERRVPETYWTQKVQYFVTNEHLETLYWVFYNPRIPMLPLFILVVKREDLGHWPETMKKYQKGTLAEIDKLTNRLLEESDEIILPATSEKGEL